MKWSFAANLAVLVEILAGLGARPALAAERPCSPLAIEADSQVRAQWPELMELVHQAFDARGDIDTCARVLFSMREASLSVEVILPDGRSASRSVSRREDAIPTLEALLLVPQHEVPAIPDESARTPTPRPAAPAQPVVPAPGALGVSERDAPPSLPEEQQGSLRVELSVAAGARLGDGQASFGLAALTLLDITGWLVGIGGRLDQYQELAGGPPAPALELAVLGGRRSRFQTLALDFIAGPALALQGGFATEEGGPAGVEQRETSSGTVPRLLAATRLTFGARSVLRTFVGLDGEVGLARSDERPGDTGRIPMWTLGLALGATVGTQ